MTSVDFSVDVSQLGLSKKDVSSLSYSQVANINKSLQEAPLSQLIYDSLSTKELIKLIESAGIPANASAVAFDRIERIISPYILQAGMSMLAFRHKILPLVAKNSRTPTADVSLLIALWNYWSSSFNSNSSNSNGNGNDNDIESSSSMLDESVDWIVTNHYDDHFWFDLILKRIKPKMIGIKSITFNTFIKLLDEYDIVLNRERFQKLEAVLRTGGVFHSNNDSNENDYNDYNNYSSSSNDIVDLKALFKVCSAVTNDGIIDNPDALPDSVLIRLLKQLYSKWLPIKSYFINTNKVHKVTLKLLGDSLRSNGIQLSQNDMTTLWGWLWCTIQSNNSNPNRDTLTNLTPTRSSTGVLSMYSIEELLTSYFAVDIANNYDALSAVMPSIPYVRYRKAGVRVLNKSSFSIGQSVPISEHNIPPPRLPPPGPISEPHLRPIAPKSAFDETDSESGLPWNGVEIDKLSNLCLRMRRLFKQITPPLLDAFWIAVYKQSTQFVAKGTFKNALVCGGLRCGGDIAEAVWREISLMDKGMPTVRAVAEYLRIVLPPPPVDMISIPLPPPATAGVTATVPSSQHMTSGSMSLANTLQTNPYSYHNNNNSNNVLPSSSSSSSPPRSSSLSSCQPPERYEYNEVSVSPLRTKQYDHNADSISNAITTLRASRLPLAVIFRSLGSGSARAIELASALVSPPLSLDITEHQAHTLIKSAAGASSQTPIKNVFISFKTMVDFLDNMESDKEHSLVIKSRIISKLEASSAVQGDPLKMLALTTTLRQRLKVQLSRSTSSWTDAPDDISVGDLGMLLKSIDVVLTASELNFLYKQIEKSETTLSGSGIGGDEISLGAAVTAIAALMSI